MIEVDKVPSVRLVTDPASQTLDVRAICEAIQEAAADLRAAKDMEADDSGVNCRINSSDRESDPSRWAR